MRRKKTTNPNLVYGSTPLNEHSPLERFGLNECFLVFSFFSQVLVTLNKLDWFIFSLIFWLIDWSIDVLIVIQISPACHQPVTYPMTSPGVSCATNCYAILKYFPASTPSVRHVWAAWTTQPAPASAARCVTPPSLWLRPVWVVYPAASFYANWWNWRRSLAANWLAVVIYVTAVRVIR